MLLKFLPVLTLMVAVNQHVATAHQSQSWVPRYVSVFIALALSCVGDALLVFPGEYALYGGIVSFGLAHLAYIYSIREGTLKLKILGPLLITLAAVVFVIIPESPFFRLAVFIYGLLLVCMAASAVSQFDPKKYDNNKFMVAVGGILFVISDTILATCEFALQCPEILHSLVMVTYYSAQFSLMHIIFVDSDSKLK